MASSSSAPNANEVTTAKRTAAALGPTDPAPPAKRRQLTFASPPPSSVKAATSRRATSPSPSAGKTAPRARAVRGTRTPTRATPSVKAAAWAMLPSSRSPTRFFAGKCSPPLARGIRTPGTASSVMAASWASRSAGKAATPAVRGTPRMATSKHLAAKLRRLKDDMISSLSKIKKEATEGRDAAATVVASVLQEASIFDSVIRNTSEFSYICDSAKVSDPVPTVDAFLAVYNDTIQWKNIAESVASVELSSAKYWVGGGPHVIHELSLPNAPKTKSTTKDRSAEHAKDLCGQMQRWFLAFVEEALDVKNKSKHSSHISMLLSQSQFEKITDWLEQVQNQVVEEWTQEMIKRLKHRIGHNLRRLKEWGPVAPRTLSLVSSMRPPQIK